MEFLYEYGLFFAKALTIVVAIVAVLVVVLATAVKQKSEKGELKLTNLSEELVDLKHHIKQELYTKKQFKAYEKELKAEQKQQEKDEEDKPKSRVFVIDFKAVLMPMKCHHYAVKLARLLRLQTLKMKSLLMSRVAVAWCTVMA